MEVAPDLPTARSIFSDLLALHTVWWDARGKPGAFASQSIRDFHESLVEEGLPRGEVQLLRFSNPSGAIGCLYNFVHRGRVLSYQSGFRLPEDNQQKPGLVCHSRAIELNRGLGHKVYDFLSWDAQYKRSLGNSEAELRWTTLQKRSLQFWAERRARALVRALRPKG